MSIIASKDESYDIERIERLAMRSTFTVSEAIDMLKKMDQEDVITLLLRNQQIPGLHFTPHTIEEQWYAIRYNVDKDDFYERNTNIGTGREHQVKKG